MCVLGYVINSADGRDSTTREEQDKPNPAQSDESIFNFLLVELFSTSTVSLKPVDLHGLLSISYNMHSLAIRNTFQLKVKESTL